MSRKSKVAKEPEVDVTGEKRVRALAELMMTGWLSMSRPLLREAGLVDEAQLRLFVSLTAMSLILLMKDKDTKTQDDLALHVCQEYMYFKKEAIGMGAWKGVDTEVGFQLLRHEGKE